MLRALLVAGLLVATAVCAYAADSTGLAADMDREFGATNKMISKKEAQALARIQGKVVGGRVGGSVVSVARPVSVGQEAKNNGVIPSYPKGAN